MAGAVVLLAVIIYLLFIRGEEPPAVNVGFQRASVQLVVTQDAEESKVPNAKTAIVYFIGNGTPQDRLKLAQQCVHEYRKTYDGVRCFLFPSLSAYKYARISPKSGKWFNSCWIARWSLLPAEDGTYVPDGASGNVVSARDGCPGAYRGSGDDGPGIF